MEHSEDYLEGRRDGYRAGYGSARTYYETRAVRTDRAVAAWQAAPSPRALQAIRTAWPELAAALDELAEWKES